MFNLIIYTLLVIYITKCLVSELWWEILERKNLARTYINSKGKKVTRLLYRNEIMKWEDSVIYDFSVGDKQHEIDGNRWLDEY